MVSTEHNVLLNEDLSERRDPVTHDASVMSLKHYYLIKKHFIAFSLHFVFLY